MDFPYLLRLQSRLTKGVGTGVLIEARVHRTRRDGELIQVFQSFREAGAWLSALGYRYSLGTPGIWARRP